MLEQGLRQRCPRAARPRSSVNVTTVRPSSRVRDGHVGSGCQALRSIVMPAAAPGRRARSSSACAGGDDGARVRREREGVDPAALDGHPRPAARSRCPRRRRVRSPIRPRATCHRERSSGDARRGSPRPAGPARATSCPSRCCPTSRPPPRTPTATTRPVASGATDTTFLARDVASRAPAAGCPLSTSQTRTSESAVTSDRPSPANAGAGSEVGNERDARQEASARDIDHLHLAVGDRGKCTVSRAGMSTGRVDDDACRDAGQRDRDRRTTSPRARR